ncbi:MAG: OmpA family protein [Candidatus Zixiibacteriota bacterium]
MDDNRTIFCSISTAAVILILLCALPVSAGGHRFAVGLRSGPATLLGGDSDAPDFTMRLSYGGYLVYRLHDMWSLEADVTLFRLYNDTSAGSSFTFGGDKADATRAWKATRLGLLLHRNLLSSNRLVNLSLGFGGGAMIWTFDDPIADTTLKERGERNETVDFSATEIFVSAAAEMNLPLSNRWSLYWNTRADYLTGAGTEFQSDVNSDRPRWLIGSSIGVAFSFGRAAPESRWPSETSWPQASSRLHSSTSSEGANRPLPAILDRRTPGREKLIAALYKSAVDSDGDGIGDDRDDCPGTDPRARGHVDIFGCPVDSDFDGIPDYLDNCPHNPVGAAVDESGCPLDADADGVPDGLDDCPNTLYGVDIDRHGCIDLSILDKPLVLNIDYAPGSFDVDPANRRRLEDLARILNFVSDVRVEINGYTDNIGTERANQQLSEKRARRVLDYLKTYGVPPERMTAVGRGETDFVASNQTAEGRAGNRRIEIVFYR